MKNFDDFDDEPNGGFLGSVGPKAAFLIVLIALSFLIGVVWKLYSGGAAQDGAVNVPIVRAGTEPTKIVPDDRGGMEIPHRDSTLFSSLGADKPKAEKIENLLAEDENEEPIPRSQLFAGLNTEPNPDLDVETAPTPLDQPVSDKVQALLDEEDAPEKVEQKVEEVAEEVGEPIKLAPTPIIEEPKAEKTETKPEVKEITEAPKVVEKKPTAITPKKPEPVKEEKTVPSTTTGDYVVQLASIKDKSLAEKEWKKFSAKYAPALSGLGYRIQTADLGEKGVFHRIQAGPVSKDKASSVCAAIKKIAPSGCIVKKK